MACVIVLLVAQAVSAQTPLPLPLPQAGAPSALNRSENFVGGRLRPFAMSLIDAAQFYVGAELLYLRAVKPYLYLGIYGGGQAVFQLGDDPTSQCGAGVFGVELLFSQTLPKGYYGGLFAQIGGGPEVLLVSYGLQLGLWTLPAGGAVGGGGPWVGLLHAFDRQAAGRPQLDGFGVFWGFSFAYGYGW